MDVTDNPGELTILLRQCALGDVAAEHRVFEVAYRELRNIARNAFRSERRGHTLQPSVLVNEAFLRMPHAGEIDWKGSRHFFAIAARAMRRALIDYARGEAAVKRLPSDRRVDLDAPELSCDTAGLTTVLLVDAVLDEFARLFPRQARVVEMHFFAGMTFAEIGATIGRDERTAKRYWKFARLWFAKRLEGEAAVTAPA